MTRRTGSNLPDGRLLRRVRRSIAVILFITLVVLGYTLYQLLF